MFKYDRVFAPKKSFLSVKTFYKIVSVNHAVIYTVDKKEKTDDRISSCLSIDAGMVKHRGTEIITHSLGV